MNQTRPSSRLGETSPRRARKTSAVYCENLSQPENHRIRRLSAIVLQKRRKEKLNNEYFYSSREIF
jgi:hypothetical protein